MSKISEDSLLSKDEQYVWHPFGALKDDWEVLPVVSGKGAYLMLEDGRQILDGIASWWVNLHGHSNAYMAEAIAKQACTLDQVIFSGFTHEPAVAIAERLVKLLPGNMRRAFFSDDGSTSVEVALKMAIQYWHNIGSPKRKILALDGAYHGDTFGAMAVGDRGAFTLPFHSMLFDVEFIPFPEPGKEQLTYDALRQAVARGDIAAFIYEPLVQGAGGMRIYTPEILDYLLKLAKQANVLCIADEVMTGFGRTGTLFASQQAANKPDLICLSKGITGGYLPMGLTVCNKKIEDAFMSPESRKALYHGHSYTANPIACAAANASLNLLLDENLQLRIKSLSHAQAVFAKKLKGHAKVKSAKSCGTILAIELVVEEGSGYFSNLRRKLYKFFLDRNILLRPLGNTVYIMPPYVVTDAELSLMHQAIQDLIEELSK